MPLNCMILKGQNEQEFYSYLGFIIIPPIWLIILICYYSKKEYQN